MGGYLFPCSPEINFALFPVPQNCLCSPFPLMFRRLYHYSPEINALVRLLPKTPGRASSMVVTFHSLLSSPNLTVYYNVAVLNATFEPRHDKTNKVSVRPAKTQISLGIRPV